MRRFLTWPLRLYRRRISSQIIATSLIVVLLNVLLIEAVILGITISLGDFSEPAAIDQTLGRQAEYVATELAQTPAMQGDGTIELTPGDRDYLQLRLDELVSSGAPTYEGGPRLALGDDGRAAVVDRQGIVIATTDSGWTPLDQPFLDSDFEPARVVVQRAFELQGEPTGHGYTFVLDYQGDRLAAAHPILTDDGVAGVLLLQSNEAGNVEPTAFWEYVVLIVAANIALLAVMVVPALAVAIPVGIYQARRISRRLERLADAATAMAQGDLSQRVDIAGEDEVAQVSRRFNEMVAQLERADQARRAFVSNVSHELRTPLAILQGNLERMRAEAERPGGEQPDPATLEAMHQETLTLARLIDDLFTLARIEEAVIEFEAGPVDLNAAIRHAVEGIARLAWEQSRVSVESVAPDGLPAVLGERTRIQQILGNLLHNALRHTPEGGLIVIGAEQAGDEVLVSVSDTGIGIAPEDLGHVFERYYQGERGGRHAGGSGLGLAVVKQLVAAMGGTITVESAPEQGTTFRFSLPVYRNSR